MNGLIKRIFGDSVIYGLASIISSLLSIFLVPFYTRVFNPSDYGIISIVTTTFAFLNLLVIFGVDSSVCVWYWEQTSKRAHYKLFNTFFVFVCFTGMIAGILTFVLSRPLSNVLFNSSSYAVLFFLLAVNLMFSGFQKVVNIWCRMQQKPTTAMVYSLLLLAVNLSLNIVLILFMRVGIKGVFYSQAITSFIGFLLLVLLFKKWINVYMFEMRLLKKLLRFSLPLVPATLMYWMMTAASSYFIKFYVKDYAQLGLYQVGSNIANIISLITFSFFQAWGPISLEISNQANARKIYSIAFELYCVIGFFTSFALLLTAGNILDIFTNHKYAGAATIVGLLGINVIMAGIPNFIAVANNLAKKNSSYAIAVAIGCATTVVGFTLLIPILGKEGAAIAMIAGNIAISVFLARSAQRIYPIPYNYPRILIVVGVELCYFLFFRSFVTNLVWQIAISLLLIIIISTIYARKYQINPIKLLQGRSRFQV